MWRWCLLLNPTLLPESSLLITLTYTAHTDPASATITDLATGQPVTFDKVT